MMGARVLESGSAKARRDAAIALLSALPKTASAVIIGNDLIAARVLVHRAAANRSAALGWEATTLSLLASRLAVPELARLGMAPVLGAGSVAMVGRALGQLSEPALESASFGKCLAPVGRLAKKGRVVRQEHLNTVLGGVFSEEE